jgi:acyl-coenzyme A thioesterase PaaI-like protein
MKKGPFKMKRKSPMLAVLGKRPNKIKKAASEFVNTFKGKNKGLLPPLSGGKLSSLANTAGKIARVGAGVLGGVGVGSLLADFHKSGQEKSGGKVRKGQKTNTMGFGNKSIFKK